MKLGISTLIGLLFVSSFSEAQQRKEAHIPQPAPDKKIDWQGVQQYDLPGAGKHSIISFTNAQYNFTNHFFPIYCERIEIPSSSSAVTAALAETRYGPITEEEKTALNSESSLAKKIILETITPSATVSIFRKKSYAYVEFVPIRKNKLTGNYEKLVAFSLHIEPQAHPEKNTTSHLNTYASNSVLTNGKWHQVSVTADGIYKMDVPFLRALGVDVDSISPKDIRVYGNGGGQVPFANASFRYDDLQENAIDVQDVNGNNLFDSTDYVLFYGQSQHRWKYNPSDKKFHHALNLYSDTTYYFINADLGPGKRIGLQNSSALLPTDTVTSFDDYAFHELEQNNLLKSGRMWLGEIFDILTSYSFTFNFPNIETTSKAFTKVDVGARRDSPGTDFTWTAGSTSSTFNVMGVATSSIFATYFRTQSDTMSFFPSSGTIPVTVSKISPSPAIGWLNYIEVNARRLLTMSGSQMAFRDAFSADTGNVAQFILSNATAALQVWEVTDPVNVKSQQLNFSGSTADFILTTDSIREFAAFNGQTFLIPKKEGEIANQDLHSMGPSDLIIVTNPLFSQQANTLADLHRDKDNMTVSVATTEQVYNEFSSGAQDASAIRDFVRMFYDRAADSSQLPKYLLLFGRGSYNVKAALNNTNFIVSYQSGNSNEPTLSYPSDDFFGMLDTSEGNWDVTNDVLDIGVGRLPVKSVSEADIAVNKITKYMSVPGSIETVNSCSSDICYGLGDWMNVVTFCADDEDNGDHQKQANIIATKVDTTYDNYNIEKIYLDAYQQVSTPGGERYPDATAALNRRVERGSMIINYTGHGGEAGWAHERFLEIHDINDWNNQCKLPLFFTATCEFSRWDDPERTSAGELTFLNPTGGSIGLMSTTRVVYSGPNFTLNNYFYDHTFKPLPGGKMPRLGDLLMLTKRDMSPSQINHRNFSMLADPALSLNYPEYDVITTEINGAPVNITQMDTARALSKVTISGEVRDKSGNLLTNFNGIIFPTVYDKTAKITTLSNGNATPPFTFTLQKNILFKGKAAVTNGKFTFSFIIPKDIAYNFGNGRISYYAHNGYEDASGAFEDFIIGGTDSTAALDAIGPDIKLFMNDTKFAFGGTTNADPKIFVVVSDSNGVNTAGTSIGHDITAVLDGDNTKPFVLNDYYESNLNDYRSGTVRYPLVGLADGNHTLSVKVWDVYNNSSSAYTEFVVASSAEVALKHVLNYPNPFTTQTAFYFEHNKCCTTMDVQVQIFTVSGKLVKTIHQSVNMEGFRSEPIPWEGKDDFGNKIGRGVYIYRLQVKTASGETAEEFQKLVVLK